MWRGCGSTEVESPRPCQKEWGQVPPAVLNLDFNDFSTIVNGAPKDKPCNRPFDSIFTEEKILGSWAKAGFVPFSRNCLKDKKVRKELGQQKADEQLENLQRRYDLLVDSFEGDGFYAGMFDLEIPTVAHVIRAETEDLLAEELVKNRKAFSSISAQWNHGDFRIGYAGVTIKPRRYNS
jgi:hypothetical protein